ncbi:MAG: CZB domain-containing protein [Bermanella sp.]
METAAATESQELSSLFDANNTLTVITFYVGKTQYATPMSEVRYIEQDKRDTTRIEVDKKVGAEVTTYQGKPVPIYDLASLMGCEAEYVGNLETLQILKAREKDHVNWMEALESCLINGGNFSLAKDPLQCAFGKWYADFEAEDEILADILEDFDAPHKKIHALADELLNLRDNGELDKALKILAFQHTKTFGKLISLFTAARERLENMTRPILLYIDTGKKMIAVRLNAISDIVNYSQSDYTTQAEVDDSTNLNKLNLFSGYLENNGDEQPPCVLLDWRLFVGANQLIMQEPLSVSE